MHGLCKRTSKKRPAPPAGARRLHPIRSQGGASRSRLALAPPLTPSLRMPARLHPGSCTVCEIMPLHTDCVFEYLGKFSRMGSGVKVTKNLLVHAKKRPAHQFALLVGKCPGGSWRGPEAPTCPGRIMGAEQVKPQRAGPEQAEPAAPPPPPCPRPALAAAQPRPAPGGGMPRGSKHGAGIRVISVHARPQQAAQQEGPARDRLGRLLVPLPRPEGQGTPKQGSRRAKKAGAGGAEGNAEEAGSR